MNNSELYIGRGYKHLCKIIGEKFVAANRRYIS